MDATSVAKPSAGGYLFSIDPAVAVAELRKLADEIEAGTVAVAEVRTGAAAQSQDFLLHSVLVRYARQDIS